jgi:hypothetical protein
VVDLQDTEKAVLQDRGTVVRTGILEALLVSLMVPHQLPRKICPKKFEHANFSSHLREATHQLQLSQHLVGPLNFIPSSVGRCLITDYGVRVSKRNEFSVSRDLLPLLIYTRMVTASRLGQDTGYRDWRYSWFSSVSTIVYWSYHTTL